MGGLFVKKRILLIIIIALVFVVPLKASAFNLSDNLNILVTCEEMLGGKAGGESLLDIINEIFGYVKILVPILLIVFIMLDMLKAVVASKEDAIKKATSDSVKRVIAAVAIFFVSDIVMLILSFVDSFSGQCKIG